MESVKVGCTMAGAETWWARTVALFHRKIDGFSMILVAAAEKYAYSLSKVSSSDLTSVALQKLQISTLSSRQMGIALSRQTE